jgi:alpha-1,2-mannosyltransferase
MALTMPLDPLALLLTWSLMSNQLRQTAQQEEYGVSSAPIDFFVFLDSSQQLLEGRSIYQTQRVLSLPNGQEVAFPNLNHPIVAPLMVPFAGLHRNHAFLLWDALSVLILLIGVALALKEIGVSLKHKYLLAIFSFILCSTGLIISLLVGQFGLVLVLPVIGAWLLLRRDQQLWGGLLIGILIALKAFLFPLLVLLLIRRSWRRLIAAAIGGVIVSAIPIPWTGVAVYYDWYNVLKGIAWYDNNVNISLIGVLYRAMPLPPPAIVGTLMSFIVGGIGLLLTRCPAPATMLKGDRDFSVLLILSILGSPLGWLYYTPLLIPVVLILLKALPGLSRVQRAITVISGATLFLPYLVFLTLPLYAAFTGSLLLLVMVFTTLGLGKVSLQHRQRNHLAWLTR